MEKTLKLLGICSLVYLAGTVATASYVIVDDRRSTGKWRVDLGTAFISVCWPAALAVLTLNWMDELKSRASQG